VAVDAAVCHLFFFNSHFSLSGPAISTQQKKHAQEQPMESPLLVLGSRNPGKLREFQILLAGAGITVKSVTEFPAAVDVEETGTTFAANAELKATQQALQLKQWVLAEDSGLSVDALDGAPGVYSARYSDPGATNERNNAKLLEALGDTPLAKRGAGYTCHIALADPAGAIVARCEEYCRGRIIFEQRGGGGFGYDPLFEIAEYHRTFGELGDSVKAVLSHRSRATRRITPEIMHHLRGA